ncbi:C6 zinc finger domain-containing protein [Pochonia chlamydosporia 170]|uniref:C6 zinc finger domain-containing protein n=1 Tax=Pochonia chlamydosporia 170 TaxID=1380566 RepID=A0A179FCB4_METCM|nr:C6 zinc finger domain-containing protein [Pochonia chlamydosporia 170]OAQ62703.1 C6 zinc finger domain-containing protein [Pochonia chlamydosporia 170]
MPRKRDPSKQPSRRSHHGCQRCRQHKVRCDEVKPQCGFCRSRGHSPCIFSAALKWEADYKHKGRAFGRAGVWSKVSADGGNSKGTPIESRCFTPPLPRIHSYGFLNTSIQDFEQESGGDDHDTALIHSTALMHGNSPGTDLRYMDKTRLSIYACLGDSMSTSLQSMDPHLVSYYVYRVCPLTVPASNANLDSPFSALLVPFALSSSSTIILEALLGLAASHRSRSDSTYKKVALSYYRRTVHYLRTLLATRTPKELITNPEILVLMMLLCQHELIRDEESNWVIHLRGARDLITYQRQQQVTSEGNALTRQAKPCEQITLFAERYFAFYDVMGRTACGEQPIFGSDFWSGQDERVDPWMGCSPRLVNIISAITELSWKYQHGTQSPDRRRELDEQRDRLRDALQSMVGRSGASDSPNDAIMLRCTELKRLTVDLYMHAALQDSSPTTHATKQKIRDILRLVSKLLTMGIYAGLTWPLFMAACQLDPSEELEWASTREAEERDMPTFSRPFILFALDKLKDSLSSVSRTRLVIEKVWRRREAVLFSGDSVQKEEAFNDWAYYVAPLCHNLSVA